MWIVKWQLEAGMGVNVGLDQIIVVICLWPGQLKQERIHDLWAMIQYKDHIFLG